MRYFHAFVLVVGLLLVAVATARPMTQGGPVLILATHPDDETLGCGGLIARRVHEGRRVVVVVLTDGRALLRRFGIAANPSETEVSAMRKEETRRSVEILGARAADIRFLDFGLSGVGPPVRHTYAASATHSSQRITRAAL